MYILGNSDKTYSYYQCLNKRDVDLTYTILYGCELSLWKLNIHKKAMAGILKNIFEYHLEVK